MNFINYSRPRPGAEHVNDKYKCFRKIISDFYARFSSEKVRNHNVGQLHFKLNLILTVIHQMVENWNGELLDLGINNARTFDRHVKFIFDVAAAEMCNIRAADEVDAHYPAQLLLEETVRLLNQKEFCVSTFEVIEEVIPIALHGRSFEVDAE